MADFQTQAQSQWENESSLNDQKISTSEAGSNGNNKSHKKLYIIVGLLFIIAVTTIFSVYTFGRPIKGTWVRQADDHVGAEGMVVEVVKNGSYYEGKVVGDSNDKSKFKSGQIKWFQIKKSGFGVYECFDLCLEEDTNTFYYDGTITTLSIMASGNTLTLESPNHSKGSHQIWVKQK